MKITSCNPHTCTPDKVKITPQENKNKKIVAKPRDPAQLLKGYWEYYAGKFYGDMIQVK